MPILLVDSIKVSLPTSCFLKCAKDYVRNFPGENYTKIIDSNTPEHQEFITHIHGLKGLSLTGIDNGPIINEYIINSQNIYLFSDGYRLVGYTGNAPHSTDISLKHFIIYKSYQTRIQKSCQSKDFLDFKINYLAETSKEIRQDNSLITKVKAYRVSKKVISQDNIRHKVSKILHNYVKQFSAIDIPQKYLDCLQTHYYNKAVELCENTNINKDNIYTLLISIFNIEYIGNIIDSDEYRKNYKRYRENLNNLREDILSHTET